MLAGLKSCKWRGGASMDQLCLSCTSHRCYIGLRFGEFVGQINTSNSLCLLPQIILEPFLLCAGCVFLLREATAIREYSLHGPAIWMAGAELSQQNIVQSIPLPRPACLPPKVHPGATWNPGKQKARPGYEKKMWFIRLGKLLPLLHVPVLIITCPSLTLWHWCVAMQPYTQQTVMHCAFWRLSIRTSINFCSGLSNCNLSFESEPGSLRMCISELSLHMTLTLVHHCSFFGPLLIDIDQYRLGTTHSRCSSGEALPLTHLLWGQNVHFLPNMSQPLTGAMMKT